ncbi:MAG: TIGR03960 family B12-binding radical SAM protein [Lachnospiraceae bacterium]|nr:TIGR03960 family B12-binding radical SAM protein [Lachnospiraceae bacterium]
MAKLALTNEILMQIEKPERYIGNEVNSVVKNKEDVDIRFAFCFPDVYEIGMSHLGIQILYDMFNKREDVWCERVYSPWLDLDKVLREKNIPLWCLESQDPVREFDFLGFTLQYEMAYTNILQVLDLAGVPLHAQDRTEEDPLVVGGGPCAYNPEPIAEFFDFFYIGEGEVVYDQVFDLYKEHKKAGGTRAEFLRQVSHVPGIYVPSLYEVTYNEDGTIASFLPKYEDVPAVVEKQLVLDFENAPYPDKPVVPYAKATQDRVVLEIQRGCIRGCRFCQAGMLYRPLREKGVEKMKQQAQKMLKATGYEEISLSSLSSSDYNQLPELLNYLMDICPQKGVNVSLPSLRIDKFSLDVMSKVQDVKKSSLTFAPEAGSQRMRNVINKGLTEEDILTGAGTAFEGGWNKVKLYFMLGLPGEMEEDYKGIAWLCEKVAKRYYEIPKDQRNGKVSITASASFFVPKPFTPFQWAPQNTVEQFIDKAITVKREVRDQLNQKSIRFTYHEADVSVLEGVLARGDRRVAAAIEAAYKKGAIFDAWSESFKNENWQEAFAETGVDPSFYTSRVRSTEEILPWDFISIGVTKEFLKREWETAQKGMVTPNCRQRCSGCGAKKYGGGVCFEEKTGVDLSRYQVDQKDSLTEESCADVADACAAGKSSCAGAADACGAEKSNCEGGNQ